MYRIQKRKETRVNINIPAPINKIILNNREIISPDKIFPATICNLSISGALLQSPLSVPVNLKFIFELKDEKEKILCFLIIVRKERCGDEFQYGCKLKTVFESDKERMRIFVLKKQLSNLKFLENYEGGDAIEKIM